MIEAKKLKIEFPTSGEVLYASPPSIEALTLKIRRKYPEPMPPIVRVDYGGGKVVTEYNYADPEHDKQLAKYRDFIIGKAADESMRRTVKSIKLNETQQRVLNDWKQENIGEWDDSDGDIDLFIENIAIVSREDFLAWGNFLRSGEPSSEEVKAIQDGFQG